jgi:hypothetical protein
MHIDTFILGGNEGINVADVNVDWRLFASPGNMQLHFLHVGVVDLDGKVKVVKDVLLEADVGNGDSAVENTRLDVLFVNPVKELVQVLVQNELHDE